MNYIHSTWVKSFLLGSAPGRVGKGSQINVDIFVNDSVCENNNHTPNVPQTDVKCHKELSK